MSRRSEEGGGMKRIPERMTRPVERAASHDSQNSRLTLGVCFATLGVVAMTVMTALLPFVVEGRSNL